MTPERLPAGATSGTWLVAGLIIAIGGGVALYFVAQALQPRLADALAN